jgi:hypothetical protein
MHDPVKILEVNALVRGHHGVLTTKQRDAIDAPIISPAWRARSRTVWHDAPS